MSIKHASTNMLNHCHAPEPSNSDYPNTFDWAAIQRLIPDAPEGETRAERRCRIKRTQERYEAAVIYHHSRMAASNCEHDAETVSSYGKFSDQIMVRTHKAAFLRLTPLRHHSLMKNKLSFTQWVMESLCSDKTLREGMVMMSSNISQCVHHILILDNIKSSLPKHRQVQALLPIRSSSPLLRRSFIISRRSVCHRTFVSWRRYSR
jgi:hypothetical protein